LQGGEIIALSGPLGSGKTTFVKGVAKGLKLKQLIQSPTFLLLREYPVLENPKIKRLVHIDLYRLKNEEEIASLGLSDYLGRKEVVSLIEWPDKIQDWLKKNFSDKLVLVEFQVEGKNKRTLKINPSSTLPLPKTPKSKTKKSPKTRNDFSH